MTKTTTRVFQSSTAITLSVALFCFTAIASTGNFKIRQSGATALNLSSSPDNTQVKHASLNIAVLTTATHLQPNTELERPSISQSYIKYGRGDQKKVLTIKDSVNMDTKNEYAYLSRTSDYTAPITSQ